MSTMAGSTVSSRTSLPNARTAAMIVTTFCSVRDTRSRHAFMIARRFLRRLLPQRLALRLRREWLARQVASGEGPHFEDDIPLLKTFVKPTDVCWDIGANAGTYTLHLSRLAAHVFAFEPVPHSFEILRDVTKHARLANVDARSLALSDKVAHAKMAIPVAGFYGGFYMASLDA